MDKTKALFNQFKNARERLRDVLLQPESDTIRDSAIHRFEFTFDLSWKLLKTYMEENKGVVVPGSPKEVFRHAYNNGIIEYT